MNFLISVPQAISLFFFFTKSILVFIHKSTLRSHRFSEQKDDEVWNQQQGSWLRNYAQITRHLRAHLKLPCTTSYSFPGHLPPLSDYCELHCHHGTQRLTGFCCLRVQIAQSLLYDSAQYCKHCKEPGLGQAPAKPPFTSPSVLAPISMP